MLDTLAKIFKTTEGATDIILTAGEPPAARINGEIKLINTPGYDESTIIKEIKQFMNPDDLAKFQLKKSADIALENSGVRMRIVLFRQKGKSALAIRRIPDKIPEFDLLGFTEPWLKEKIFGQRSGLIIICGPTGCGKTTTLAAGIEYLNANRRINIITIEDPIEYVFQAQKSQIFQREVGLDTQSFAEALRDAIRSNPDVIMVGEMRDPETAETALRAAETGHLVLTTLHSPGVVDAVQRIVNMFEGNRIPFIRSQLSFCLKGIIAQKLIRTEDSERKLVYEVLLGTLATKNLIREGKDQQLVTEISQQGSQTMEEKIKELTRKGLIDENANLDNN